MGAFLNRARDPGPKYGTLALQGADAACLGGPCPPPTPSTLSAGPAARTSEAGEAVARPSCKENGKRGRWDRSPGPSTGEILHVTTHLGPHNQR